MATLRSDPLMVSNKIGFSAGEMYGSWLTGTLPSMSNASVPSPSLPLLCSDEGFAGEVARVVWVGEGEQSMAGRWWQRRVRLRDTVGLRGDGMAEADILVLFLSKWLRDLLKRKKKTFQGEIPSETLGLKPMGDSVQVSKTF